MNRSRLRAFLILLLLISPLFIFVLFWPHERLLLDRARLVAATDQWDEYRNHKRAAFGHNWLNDEEVLFKLEESTANRESAGQYYILNTRSKRADRAATYERALSMANAMFGVRFSPDRQWFLVEQRNGDGLDVVKSDGQRMYSLKEKGYPLPWLTNSLFINAISAEDYANEWKTMKECLRLHSVTTDRPIKDLRGLKEVDSDPGKIAYDGNHFVSVSEELDETTKKWSITVDATSVGLNDYRTQKYTFAVTLPYRQELMSVEPRISSDGTLIVYCLELEDVNPLFASLHRIWPHFVLKPRRLAALWVSDVHGRNLHELGHIVLNDGVDPDDVLESVEWLPSNKRLAFRYMDKLYTVAAD